MEDWQQRVIKEKIYLDAKIKKLFKYLGSTLLDNMGKESVRLLGEQYNVMKQYSDILGKRIKGFK